MASCIFDSRAKHILRGSYSADLNHPAYILKQLAFTEHACVTYEGVFVSGADSVRSPSIMNGRTCASSCAAHRSMP